MLIQNAPKLNENLPAPSWSPTGDSGYWVWRNKKWGWLTDEEYEELKKGVNLLADKNFAYLLQNTLITNSIDNLLFFIPDQLSLDRLLVQNNFALTNELFGSFSNPFSSPYISNQSHKVSPIQKFLILPSLIQFKL